MVLRWRLWCPCQTLAFVTLISVAQRPERVCHCSRYLLGARPLLCRVHFPVRRDDAAFTSYFDNYTRPAAMRCEGVNSQTLQYANRCPPTLRMR